jgi:hypothetical protein
MNLAIITGSILTNDNACGCVFHPAITYHESTVQ